MLPASVSIFKMDEKQNEILFETIDGIHHSFKYELMF